MALLATCKVLRALGPRDSGRHNHASIAILAGAQTHTDTHSPNTSEELLVHHAVTVVTVPIACSLQGPDRDEMLWQTALERQGFAPPLPHCGMDSASVPDLLFIRPCWAFMVDSKARYVTW